MHIRKIVENSDALGKRKWRHVMHYCAKTSEGRPGFALREGPTDRDIDLSESKKAPDKPGHISRFKERLEKNH